MRWFSCVLSVVFIAALCGCNDSDSDGGGHDFGDNDQDLIVAMGDSITTGRGVAAGSFPSQLSGIVGKRVINAGVNGARSGDGAALVGGVLRAYKPGYVLVLYGANDIIHQIGDDTIVANLRTILQRAKDNSTMPVIGTLTPMYESYSVFSERINGLNSRIREMAREEGVRVANLNRAFGDRRDLIQSDGVHPTAEGAGVMATIFGAVIQ